MASHGVVHFAVAGQAVGVFHGRNAIPIGESAARFLDNHLQGGDVPFVHAVLDHELAGALSEQQVAVIVAKAALPLRRLAPAG